MCLGNVFLQPRHYETCCRPDLSSFLISFGDMKPKREKIEIEILRVWTMEALEKRRSDLNFRRICTLTKMHCFFRWLLYKHKVQRLLAGRRRNARKLKVTTVAECLNGGTPCQTCTAV